MLSDPENMDIAVGISSLSCAFAEIPVLCFESCHLGFLTSYTSDSVIDGTIEKFDPVNMEVIVGSLFL